jgi:deoxycitidine kinase
MALAAAGVHVNAGNAAKYAQDMFDRAMELRCGVPLIVIFGNIAAGKSSLVDSIVKDIPGIMRMDEPVELWQKIGLLQAFYDELGNTDPNSPKWRSFTFQAMAFITRLLEYKKINWKNYRCAVADGHILNDKMVFAENLSESGKITPEQMTYYRVMFDCWQQVVAEAIPYHVIYLRVPPATCEQRKDGRGRQEEKGIKLDYFQKLDARYEALVASLDKDRLTIIDAKQPEEVVAGHAKAVVLDCIYKCNEDNRPPVLRLGKKNLAWGDALIILFMIVMILLSAYTLVGITYGLTLRMSAL